MIPNERDMETYIAYPRSPPEATPTPFHTYHAAMALGCSLRRYHEVVINMKLWKVERAQRQTRVYARWVCNRFGSPTDDS